MSQMSHTAHTRNGAGNEISRDLVLVRIPGHALVDLRVLAVTCSADVAGDCDGDRGEIVCVDSTRIYADFICCVFVTVLIQSFAVCL